jgi:hypothetical protein
VSQRKNPASKRPTKPAEASLRPHKIVGQLIGARYNEHGEIVGEEVMADVAIFKPNFGKVEQAVEAAFQQARGE